MVLGPELRGVRFRDYNVKASKFNPSSSRFWFAFGFRCLVSEFGFQLFG